MREPKKSVWEHILEEEERPYVYVEPPLPTDIAAYTNVSLATELKRIIRGRRWDCDPNDRQCAHFATEHGIPVEHLNEALDGVLRAPTSRQWASVCKLAQEFPSLKKFLLRGAPEAPLYPPPEWKTEFEKRWNSSDPDRFVLSTGDIYRVLWALTKLIPDDSNIKQDVDWVSGLGVLHTSIQHLRDIYEKAENEDDKNIVLRALNAVRAETRTVWYAFWDICIARGILNDEPIAGDDPGDSPKLQF
jgi:hypothetical protein